MPRLNRRRRSVETAKHREGSLLMKAKFVMAAVVVVAALSAPLAAQAQGVIGGGQQGVAIGQRAAGPVGAVVGGVVGGVKGVIGIPQEPVPVRHRRSR